MIFTQGKIYLMKQKILTNILIYPATTYKPNSSQPYFLESNSLLPRNSKQLTNIKNRQ